MFGSLKRETFFVALRRVINSLIIAALVLSWLILTSLNTPITLGQSVVSIVSIF